MTSQDRAEAGVRLYLREDAPPDQRTAAVEALLRIIREAVLEEREICARLAETEPPDWHPAAVRPGKRIARRIRERS